MKYFPIFSPFCKTSIQTELKLTFAVVCVQTRDDERNNYFPKKNFSNPLKIHYNVTIWDNGCYFPSLDSFHPSYNTYSRLDCYIIVCVQKLIRTQNYCYFFSTKNRYKTATVNPRVQQSSNTTTSSQNYDFF